MERYLNRKQHTPKSPLDRGDFGWVVLERFWDKNKIVPAIGFGSPVVNREAKNRKDAEASCCGSAIYGALHS